MSYGSSAPDARDALVTILTARPALAAVPVLREYPLNPADVKTSTGVNEAIYLGREGGQNITGQAVIPVFKATPLVFDESYTMWLSCQVLKDTSSGTQEAAQERAWTLAAEVVGAVATDPRLGLTDTSTRTMFHVGGEGDAYQFAEVGGFLASGGYGCSVQIGLNCTARIVLS